MEIKDTLAAWIEFKQTNPTRLSSASSGLNQPTIQRILSGETPDPRIGTLHKLAAALGITIDELRVMPKSNEHADVRHKQAVDSVRALSRESNSATPPRPVRAWTNEDELESGDILVPALELRLSAGPGEVCWQVDRKGRGRVFQSDYLDRLGVKQECAATMTVSGTSMEPRLWDGDSVLVDYCRQTVLDGNVYALVWQDEYYIKRLFKEPGGSIRMVSDNPDKSRHPDRLITTEHMEELQIIGRVVGIVGGRL